MITNKFFVKIKPTISLILILLISSVVIITLSLQYYFSKDLALNATKNSFRLTAEKIEQKVVSFDKKNSDIINTLMYSKDMKSFPIKNENHALLKQLTVILENNKHIYAIYAGNKNGDFHELIDLNIHSELREIYKVSKNIRWLIIKIYEENNQKVRYEEYLDKNLKIVETRKKIAKYNPSIRPWFKEAVKSKSSIKTKPYKYTNFHASGITYAKKINNSDVVLGVDVLIDSISDFLHKQTSKKDNQIFLFQKNGKIVASTNYDKKSEKIPYKQIINFSKDKEITSLNFNMLLDKEYFVYYSIINSNYKVKDYLAILIPTDTIMKPFIDKIMHSFLITLLILTFTIPLIWYSTRILIEPIQKLERENEKISKRDFDNVKMIKTRIKEYHELSLSLYNMSTSIKDYELKQEELMDSFIKLIASAIDTKSKYTGGHCERVPILTIALANAASSSNEGIFKDFKLETKDEKRELSVAAWLHDCGKVTTPEYVVDKATKLETIYNRIHEVRTRFEVVHRDITIKMYKNILSGSDEKIEKEKLETEHKKLFEEFSLIANSNIGGEFMKDEDISKVEEISKRTWIKYFDDTLGLSFDELSRIENSNSTFPKKENLLSDKTEHLIKREHFSKEEFDNFGFKMEVPTYLYNLGEVYNLTVKKGTLTQEERFKINEHMIMSIKMLEQLPFPKILEKVPEYAGAHHETLIGTGYPRKLTKEQMSIPARIMAVADIFEALTAADRPYKEAKSLSESIKILSFMVKDQHIDEDIFKLFLTSGVYKEYAKEYLKEEQIDEVDISKYV